MSTDATAKTGPSGGTEVDAAGDLAQLQLRSPVALHVRSTDRTRDRPHESTYVDPAVVPIAKLPAELREQIDALRDEARRLHGSRLSLAWFPFPWLMSPCRDRFGYLSSKKTRTATALPMTPVISSLLDDLGGMMGDPGRDTGPDSVMPSGFTYVGQFVDHDITLDVSSTLGVLTDANTIRNMRTPALDLDSVYGRGPALDSFLYVFPSAGPPTAIRMALGTNTNQGPGGPGGVGQSAGMVAKTDFDLPRMNGTNTAVIGDPRNDENLIVSQFHHAMLRFHNRVVDHLVGAGFAGDIFVEAKKTVVQHYQWAVVHDFLPRICGPQAVNDALANVVAPIGSPFRMPVEFSVAAYRFGHSQIRQEYWLNFNFIKQPLDDVFNFIRNPRLPVFSNWVVDFNAFFDTGVFVPVNNKARRIDSILAAGLESLPGFAGMMAILAARNLHRGLALGLPSGQGIAKQFGIAPLTSAQILSGLPPAEQAILQASGSILLKRTPLWYYVLREAAVLENGERLGPIGAKIVADTFVRMLKRDASSYLNATSPFFPTLALPTNDFTFADLIRFSEVNQP